jgi:hypothetical protein
MTGRNRTPKTKVFDTMCTSEKKEPETMTVSKAKDELSPTKTSEMPNPKLVIKSYVRAMKAPKTAVSRENLAEKLMSRVSLLYKPPRTPAITIPAIWKGMLIPPNPYEDKNPLASITKLPKHAPHRAPNVKPITKQKKEVNSTFGGLGVI